MGNVVVPLLMLAGGGALVWSGITDPEGGTFGGLSALMRGEQPAKRAADPTASAGIAATLATVATSRRGGGGGGTTGTPAANRPTPTPVTPARPGRTPRSIYSLGSVKPHVARAANLIGPMFGITSVGGYRASAIDPNGHPAGRALDFMVSDSRGTALASYVLANRRQLGVEYVIWRQRINSGTGWRSMADRGSPTQNHMDHVHVNFIATDPRGGSTTT